MSEPEELVPGILVRASSNGPILNQGQPLIIAYVTNASLARPVTATVSIFKTSRTKTKDLKGLGPCVLAEAEEGWEHIRGIIKKFTASRKPSIFVELLATPEHIESKEIKASSEQTATECFNTAGWELGEYSVYMRDENRNWLFSDSIFIVDLDLCVVNAYETLDRPPFRPHNASSVSFSISELLQEICARRQSQLSLSGRDNVECYVECNLSQPTPLRATGIRQLLAGDIESILGHAEALIFRGGSITVSAHLKNDNIEIGLDVASEYSMQWPSKLHDLLIREQLVCPGSSLSHKRKVDFAHFTYTCPVSAIQEFRDAQLGTCEELAHNHSTLRL